MIAAGLDLIAESGENKVFRLPCPQSNCGSCMIYETRFEICRTFECALLGRAQKGELSLPEAQEKVAIARGLLAKVVETDPEAKTLRGRNEARARLAEQVGNRSEHERAAIAHRLLAMVALETFLQRWFRHRGEKTAPEELPTMTSKR